MKKPLVFIFFLAVITILPYLSCGSQPQAAPQPEQPAEPAPGQPETTAAQPAAPTAQSAAPVTQPTAPTDQPVQALPQDDLDTAIARAQEARRQAGDFEGLSYFPSDWEAADEHYAQAEQLPRGNEADIRNAINAYNATADSFDSIFRLAVPLYAQAREDEIMEIRGNLVDSGARIYFHEFLRSADNTALLALDQYEAADYYSSKATAANALQMFHILTTAFDTWQKKQVIDRRNFKYYDLDNYDRTEVIINNAIDAYSAGNLSIAQENANEALLRYSLILSTGWAGFAIQRSQQTEAEHQVALNQRANIAAGEYFTVADAAREKAMGLLAAEHYEEAVEQFDHAQAMFIRASLTTLERMNAATTAIREAIEKIEESDRAARQAETIIEGGQQ